MIFMATGEGKPDNKIDSGIFFWQFVYVCVGGYGFSCDFRTLFENFD